MPLATGEVKPEGIALTMILGRRGSWPARAEMLRRAVQDPGVQGGEWSMAQYLYRIDKGDRPLVGLPVFPLRNFTARDLYVRRGGPIRRPEDLAGKRIGMYSYTASGSIWYRHFLRFVGLDPAPSSGGSATSTRPGRRRWTCRCRPGVKAAPPGRSLSDMLIAGELEAIYSPPRPQAYHPADGPLARLFPDFRRVEQDYFRKTGAFPPQHLIVLRREVWEANRWIARSLTEAFVAANDNFTAAQRSFPYATPWLEAELEDTAAVMGDDFHPYGFERNRAQIEMFAGEAFRLGLTRRRVTVEEYFADFLASLTVWAGTPTHAAGRAHSHAGRRDAVGAAAAGRGVLGDGAAADAAGFDAVWVGDSVVAKPRLEAMTTLAYLAGITSGCASGRRCCCRRCASRSSWPS